MNNIRVLRKKMHMTQEEFSEYSGVSVPSISRYEKGDRINLSNAKKIAKACSVSIDYVLGIDTGCDFSKPVFGEILNDAEKEIIVKYRSLSIDKKIQAITFIDYLAKSSRRKQ